jgi:hypothetical protein
VFIGLDGEALYEFGTVEVLNELAAANIGRIVHGRDVPIVDWTDARIVSVHIVEPQYAIMCPESFVGVFGSEFINDLLLNSFRDPPRLNRDMLKVWKVCLWQQKEVSVKKVDNVWTQTLDARLIWRGSHRISWPDGRSIRQGRASPDQATITPGCPATLA